MRLVSLSGVESVVHPVHGEATAGADGVFELADDFGRALLADAAHWREESTHLAEKAKEELESLTEPGHVAEVLTELRDEIAQLKEKVTELEGKSPEKDPEKTAEEPAKPADPTTPAEPAKTAAAPAEPVKAPENTAAAVFAQTPVKAADTAPVKPPVKS